MRYAVINEAGETVNVIIWDGESEHTLERGTRLEPAPMPEQEPDKE